LRSNHRQIIVTDTVFWYGTKCRMAMYEPI
jgi:hypothetical protein